jgi:hypothetical protein
LFYLADATQLALTQQLLLANRYKQADQWRKTSIVLSKFKVLALAILP